MLSSSPYVYLQMRLYSEVRAYMTARKKRKDGRLALMSFNSARLVITMRTSNGIESQVAVDIFSNK